MHLRIVIALSLVLLAGCSTESRKARHLDRANRYLQAEQIDKAEVEYVSVLQLDRANKTALRQLGLIYFDEGRPNKAYPLLKQAENLDPDALDVRLKLASLFLAGRKYKDVHDEAEYILRQQPGHDEALVFLADAAHNAEEVQATRNRLENMRGQLESRAGFHLALGTLALRE